HGRDDHDIAGHHEDDDPARDRAPDSERDIDRDQQRLVGERIEQGAQFALHVEALGQEAVDGVADACNDEDCEGNPHLAGDDRPDDDRHQNDASQCNDIWNAQLGRFPASGPGSGAWRDRPVLIYIVYVRSACEPLQDRRIPRNQPSSYWNLAWSTAKTGLHTPIRASISMLGTGWSTSSSRWFAPPLAPGRTPKSAVSAGCSTSRRRVSRIPSWWRRPMASAPRSRS